MLRLISTSLVVLALSTLSAMADNCTPPGASPTVPDGKVASRDEMVAGSQAVRDFQSATEAYIDCIDAEDERLADMVATVDKPEQQEILAVRQSLIERHNAAVDELQSVAGAFNKAVRDYKARAESAE